MKSLMLLLLWVRPQKAGRSFWNLLKRITIKYRKCNFGDNVESVGTLLFMWDKFRYLWAPTRQKKISKEFKIYSRNGIWVIWKLPSNWGFNFLSKIFSGSIPIWRVSRNIYPNTNNFLMFESFFVVKFLFFLLIFINK